MSPDDNNVMDESEFKKLKTEHEEAVRVASEAKGVIRALKERLRKEFGLKNTVEAKARLEALNSELVKLRREFKAALVRYQKEFPNEK